MKEIPNKITTVPRLSVDGKPTGEFMSFAELTIAACDCMPQSGFDLGTLRARLRIEKALSCLKAGDVIKLEDADYTVAQDVVRNCRWKERHYGYVELAEAYGV